MHPDPFGTPKRPKPIPQRRDSADSGGLGNHSPEGGVIFKTLFLLILAAAVFGGGAYFTYTLFLQPEQALKKESALGSMTPPPDPTIPEYQLCLDLKNQHDWENARTAYEHFLETYPASTKKQAALDDLGEVNVALYLSGGASADRLAYIIRPGDTLARLEKKLKAPGDLIMKLNGISDPRRLRIGDTLYVTHPDFSLIIDRKSQLVTLYNHQRYFKQYHPRRWAEPAPKGSPPPIPGKVADLAASRNGQRLPPGARDSGDAAHSILINPPTWSLFADPAEGGEKVTAGIILPASDTDELSALLTRGIPVTIR